MLIITYDGTFEGLLTVVYDCYYKKLTPDHIQGEKDVEKDFVSQYIYIETQQEKAERVYGAIEEKISPQALKNCYYAYLSHEDTKALTIYYYIRLGFKKGRDVDALLTHKTVAKLQGMVQKVVRERHRMLGLTRFMELEGGSLLAKIQPKYNILSLIAPHFAERLGKERWIIHDEGRDLMVIGTKGKWLLRDYIGKGPLKLHKKEEMFQSLWREFHQSIAIKDRKNVKLQQQFMPKRYWENLTEMKKKAPKKRPSVQGRIEKGSSEGER